LGKVFWKKLASQTKALEFIASLLIQATALPSSQLCTPPALTEVRDKNMAKLLAKMLP
jgi:hypothetical protein